MWAYLGLFVGGFFLIAILALALPVLILLVAAMAIGKVNGSRFARTKICLIGVVALILMRVSWG